MTRRTAISGIAAFACGIVGCEAPMRLQPGMAGLIVRVRAEPKTGYVPPGTTAGSDPYASPNQASAQVEFGRFERIDYDALSDIVVWAAPRDARPPAVTPPVVTVDVPRIAPSGGGPVRATGVGGRVLARSRRDDPTGVYSVSDGNDFDLGRLAPDGETAWSARTPGLVEVLCEAFPEPIAQIYIAPSGWVSTTRSGESVRFADLPPGRYRVVCWHPRLPGSETDVVLTPDRVTRVSLTVGVNSLPKVP